MSPVRVQMSRQRPWRAEHPDAVIVARPTKWGNPFRPVRLADGSWVAQDDNGVRYPGWVPVGDGTWRTLEDALLDCVRLYRDVEWAYGLIPDVSELRGRDLACWCKTIQPCHADLLLILADGRVPRANGETS